MPFLIRRPRCARLLCALAGAFVLAGSAPAIASACSAQTTGGSTVFSHFGDATDYTLAPGGSFTAPAAGWTLNDAWLSGASAPFAGTLTIAPRGEATSATFCVSSDTPTFRFYSRQASGVWAQMNVYVIWTNTAGQTEVTCAGGVEPSTSWEPSQIYPLGSMLPTEGGGTFSVRVEFVPTYVANTNAGAVSIADFYVDPYSRT